MKSEVLDFVLANSNTSELGCKEDGRAPRLLEAGRNASTAERRHSVAKATDFKIVMFRK